MLPVDFRERRMLPYRASDADFNGREVYHNRASLSLERYLVRDQNGSHCVEFASALTLVVLFVVLPLLNASVIVVRWVLANEIISTSVRDLACCDTFRESWNATYTRPTLSNQIERIGGVKVDSVDLHLRITRVARSNVRGSEEVLLVRQPGGVPPAWLPGGIKTPATYLLVVKARIEIAPLWNNDGGVGAIPGITGAIPVSLTSMHKWENLGRNPVSGQFFLNETAMR